MSEKAKLIRGDPPKIDFKKKGEPPKKTTTSRFEPQTFRLEIFAITTTPSRTFIKTLFFQLSLLKIGVIIFFKN